MRQHHCLFIHQGKDGESSGSGHRAGASGSFPCWREHTIPVLSSYPVRYPEQTTPTVLATTIPLVKQTEFPHRDTRDPLPKTGKGRAPPSWGMTVLGVPPMLVGAHDPPSGDESVGEDQEGTGGMGTSAQRVSYFQFWICFYALVHTKNEKSMRVRTGKTLVLRPHS